MNNVLMVFLVFVLLIMLILNYINITRLRNLEGLKTDIEKRYNGALTNASEVLWEWDLETGNFFATEKWRELMYDDIPKYMEISYIDRSHINPEDRERVKNDTTAYIYGKADCLRIEFRVTHQDGKEIWVLCKGQAIRDAIRQTPILSGSIIDITEFKKAEEQVKFLAYYDTLTKLPNRTHFMERLKEEITGASIKNSSLALLFIDLDNFKNVNDTLGHNYGDELLKQISGKIRSILRNEDIACRLGGDEFLIMLTNLQDNSYIIKCAEEALQILNNMYEINDKQVYISGSIGIAIYPKDSIDPNGLLKNADAAMYKAKEAGKNKYIFFNEYMLKGLERKTKIEGILRSSIKNNELKVYYQPQYDIKTGAIIGIEALLRLNSKELGPVSPAEFIPIAEESGTIVELGKWCLRKACEKNVYLKRKGLKFGCISVNISAIQLQHNDLINVINEILDEVGLEPKFLEIELTESVLMKSMDSNINLLNELKNIGIKVALDDFGTGYSSLNYLRKIPLDKLKIDRSFITDLTSVTKNQEICEGIIQMAHNLGLQVVAEGVEKKSQLEILKEKQCDSVQGFLYSIPLADDELEEVLQANMEYLEKNKMTKKHAFKYTALYSRMSQLKEKEAEV
ncbi:putative bifunctional diguanylate cyclase/phosphodiesterase [Clostridium thermarum]|uniref:putative bifunctional diguanylate cyclase/phosphodiesterase n=1 Tax=Clostridium thermarum TaxID=1716543 RepID=UPI0013D6DAC0|nr:GGDEF domain-containing phosphodiesterase [Clostridium thermarum]